MYSPAGFRVEDAEELHALVRARPLATLVVTTPDGLVANHVPMLLAAGTDGAVVLRGHVARANPLWRHAADGCAALAVFHGPQAYVSPGWYPSKREDGRVVPTWNYAVVHAHGTLRAVDDPAWIHALVTALTDTHEAGRPAPWAVADAPAEFTARMVAAVVGIELRVNRLEGKWKMSQNRPGPDRAGVVAGLQAEGGPAGAEVAAWIAAREPGTAD